MGREAAIFKEIDSGWPAEVSIALEEIPGPGTCRLEGQASRMKPRRSAPCDDADGHRRAGEPHCGPQKDGKENPGMRALC